MDMLADLIARIAYFETVNDIKKRNPDFVPPKYEDVVSDNEVSEFAKTCADSVRGYLENKYSE